MKSRIRYLLSDPREIWEILLLGSVVFFLIEAVYYVHYLRTLHGLIDQDNEPFGRDFISYWTAVQFLKENNINGLYSMAAFVDRMRDIVGKDIGMYWGYPPQYLFVLWPLTYVTQYKLAYALWSVFNFGAFAIAVFWRTSLTSSWQWIIITAPAVFAELFIGQNGLLTSALLIGGIRLLRNKPWIAGFLFAALAFKPQLGIVIPFVLLALRQYKAFASAIMSLALLVLASGLEFGWQSWAGFFYDMQHFPQGAYHKMISVSSAVRCMGLSLSAGLAVQCIVTVTIITLLWKRLSQMQESSWPEWGKVIIPAVYLATPYVFTYDLCALGAIWVLWLHQQKSKVSSRDTMIWLVLWYSPFFSEALNDHGIPLITLLLIAVFYTSWKQGRI